MRCRRTINLWWRVMLPATIAALLATAAPAGAQTFPAPSLSLDTSFAPLSGIAETDFPPPNSAGTFRDVPAAVAVYGGRTYTVGVTGSVGDSQNVAIAARRPDGQLDSGFAGDGKLTVSIGTEADIGTGIAVLPDGRLRVIAATDQSASTDNSFDVAVVGLNANGTPDTTFGEAGANGVRRKILDTGTTNDVPTRIEVGPGGRLAIVGSRGDDLFVALLEENGSPVTGPPAGFGTTGVRFSATASLGDRGSDVVFRPGGGLVAWTFVDPPAPANDAGVLRAFRSDGTVDTAFGNGGELVVGSTDTVPGGLIVHGGRLWMSGATKGGIDTEAFIARVNADGTGLQFRRFEMRGRLALAANHAIFSEAHDLVVVPGSPETLVAVGSINYTVDGQETTDWAAAAFNGLDGDLASAGFGDVVVRGPWTGELVSVAAGPQGSVAVAGTHVLSSDHSFGNARLLVDAEKACDLAVTVGEPGEVVFHGLRPAALTARVQNVGTRPCAGTLTVAAPYGMTPMATGTIAPGAAFTTAAVPVTYHGPRRADDVLSVALDAPADSNASNNRAAAHVRFSYCDLAVRAVGRAGLIPTEGTRRFELSLRNLGTATCQVGVGSRARYPLRRGQSVSDRLAASAPRGARPGRRVRVVLAANATDDVNAADNAVTVSPEVVKVGDSDLLRWGARGFSGRARRGSGDLPSGRLRPARVHVALQRERGGRCSSLTSASGRFTRPKRRRGGGCGRPRWLSAVGTTSWRFRLRSSLPPGRYVVSSRATIGAGFREARFSAKDRNRVAFRVG